MGCLYVCLFCEIFAVLFGVLNAVPACSETESTLRSCCLCSKNESCNRTCSEGYQPFETTNVTCEPSTNSTPGNLTSSGNTSALTVTVCKRCSKQFFDNTTGQCNCPEQCQNCTVEGNCSVCKYKYNGECYDNCPNSTVPNESDKTCVPTKPNDDDKSRIIAIGAGAGGGGLLLVIVLVIVIICCCRRRRQSKPPERRAISILVDEKGKNSENQGGLPKSESKTTLTRPNYENTGGTLPSNDNILQQGDKIFRYTKDPTEKRKNPEGRVGDTSSMYGNAAMIRLHANTDLTTVNSSELLEQLELEELPTAPAPELPPAPLPQGSPKDQPQDYLDMSTEVTVGPAKHAGSKKPLIPKTASKPKESKSHAKTKMADSNVPSPTVTSSPAVKKPPDVKPKPAKPGGMNLEDYENIKTKSIPKGRQADLKVEQSAVDGMEDYENSEYTKDQPVNVKSKGSKSDLEDYENAESFCEEKKTDAKVKKGMTKESSKTSLEDYENAAVYKKLGAGGKSDQIKKSDTDGDDKDMEDYENMKELGELELYENTKFPSKKT